jgi:hypothetical protein
LCSVMRRNKDLLTIKFVSQNSWPSELDILDKRNSFL